MTVKKFNPITPGTRFRVGNTFSEVTTDEPEKSLLAPIKKSGGRNNTGKMTMRQKGGGHKRRYRIIDFKRNKDGVKAEVLWRRVQTMGIAGALTGCSTLAAVFLT